VERDGGNTVKVRWLVRLRNVHERLVHWRRSYSGAALAFGSAHEASSAPVLWKNYNAPESQTLPLLNKRHLDGMIDAIVSYSVFLKECGYFVLPLC
jgi:hypothetical protein